MDYAPYSTLRHSIVPRQLVLVSQFTGVFVSYLNNFLPIKNGHAVLFKSSYNKTPLKLRVAHVRSAVTPLQIANSVVRLIAILVINLTKSNWIGNVGSRNKLMSKYRFTLTFLRQEMLAVPLVMLARLQPLPGFSATQLRVAPNLTILRYSV